MSQPTSTRERIVVAAVDLATATGWAGVTMGRLADVVGVSRQTVYNEIGNKSALAEAMVLHELATFLNIVNDAFDHESDLVDAIERAVCDVLTYAADNTLLHAIVSATHGADTELLPLLTTNAHALLETAKEVVAGRVAPYAAEGGLAIAGAQLDAGIDVIVRVVLSHVMAPSAEPAETARDMAMISRRVLGV